MRRAVVAVTVALGLVVGLRIVGARSDAHQTKPFASHPEATSGPAEQRVATVPVVATTHVRACPAGSALFDNTAMHYSLCIPAGWGFSDLDRPEPLTEVRTVSLRNLHLLSRAAFPWHHGDELFSAIDARALVDVELNVTPVVPDTDPANPSGCVPATRESLTSCEERYEANGATPSLDGPLHMLKVWIPLLRSPERVNPDEPVLPVARLIVTARARADRYEQEVGTLWQLVRSIVAY